MNAMLIKLDDWEALYVDGKKVFEDHRVEIETIVKTLEIEGFKVAYVTEEYDGKVSESGYMPSRLDEIPDGALIL